MKRYIAFFTATLLSVSNFSIAQQDNKNHFLVGLTVFTPRTTGETYGVTSVVSGIWPGGSSAPFNNAFRSNVLFGISAGIRLDELRTSFFISNRAAEIGEPELASGGEIEFSCRYLFWEHGPANLSAIISLERNSYTSDSNPFQHGYSFGKSFWLPGIGLGTNFSVVHCEVQLHGWPGGTIIAYAAEPNGIPPGSFNQVWYNRKPIYLNYAISIEIGIEFDVFSF